MSEEGCELVMNFFSYKLEQKRGRWTAETLLWVLDWNWKFPRFPFPFVCKRKSAEIRQRECGMCRAVARGAPQLIKEKKEIGNVSPYPVAHPIKCPQSGSSLPTPWLNKNTIFPPLLLLTQLNWFTHNYPTNSPSNWRVPSWSSKVLVNRPTFTS